jgi:hypothetical protein
MNGIKTLIKMGKGRSAMLCCWWTTLLVTKPQILVTYNLNSCLPTTMALYILWMHYALSRVSKHTTGDTR